MAGPLDNKTSNTLTKQLTPLVILSSGNGISIIPQPAPLTRLNYFDGKFLRAGDLRAEQLYLRRLVDLSNQAGGPGVAHGYNLALGSGDILHLGPGLAIDPLGRVLLLPEPFSVGIQDLIEKSAQLKPSASATTSAMTMTAGNFADCATVTESQPGTVVESG